MSGPASNGDSGMQQVSIAPCAEQQQQHSAPALDIAKTELSSSASSSRDGSCHGLEHRRGSGVLRSTSSRDLDDGVREWEQPHVWLEKGPPASPCEPERLSTLRSIAPRGQLENLHHPKFGEPLRPLDSLCNILTERWALHCASALYLPFLVAPAAIGISNVTLPASSVAIGICQKIVFSYRTAYAGPLLDLACKIFGTDHAAVSLMDENEMYVLEGRGYAYAGKRIPNAAARNAFCCWSVIPSCASVLTVEDARQDARCSAHPPGAPGRCPSLLLFPVCCAHDMPQAHSTACQQRIQCACGTLAVCSCAAMSMQPAAAGRRS